MSNENRAVERKALNILHRLIANYPCVAEALSAQYQWTPRDQEVLSALVSAKPKVPVKNRVYLDYHESLEVGFMAFDGVKKLESARMVCGRELLSDHACQVEYGRLRSKLLSSRGWQLSHHGSWYK